MTTAGRHAQVAESLATPEGIVIREDYRDYPGGISNPYLLGADSKLSGKLIYPRSETFSSAGCVWMAAKFAARHGMGTLPHLS